MSLRALLVPAGLSASFFLFTACAGSPVAPADDAGTTGDEDSALPATESADARLERYLTGSFSSEAQSREVADYFDIRLAVCPVDAPELGARVLYVEQAAASSLAAPYRQRLYVVEPGDEEGHARSRVLELTTPSAWVGACAETAPRTATAADATEKVGCTVLVLWEDGRFVGGTEGHSCESTLRGASYTTSEVTITESQLESWDRGYDASDVQVWGAVAGPYRFDRVGEIAMP